MKNASLPSDMSFEQITVSIFDKSHLIFTLSIIYGRLCSSLSDFLAEFDEFLENVCMNDKFLILGDFNVHVDSAQNVYVKRFIDLLDQYVLYQFVQEPIHKLWAIRLT